MSNRRRLFQRAQPAGALGLLRHARFPGGLGFDAFAEVALKRANAKRAPALCHRQRRMHGNPHGALAAAAQACHYRTVDAEIIGEFRGAFRPFSSVGVRQCLA